ncbi:MAG: hypothetical protein P8J37_02240 [Fuerstiella sp.]|nr:hypothetical protein [Fuerstiella sp.]
MKKEQFNSWLSSKVDTQAKLTIGACVTMACLGLLAFLLQGGFLYVALSWGYGSRLLAAAIVLAIFGGMGLYIFRTAPQTLCDRQHEVQINDRTVTVRVAPTMSNAWTYAIGSLESDQSIPERIFGLMMVVPRMMWTASYVFNRIDQVRQIDVAECGKVLRLLLKKSERVDAEDIASKWQRMNLPKILRQVSLVDGIVFLTKDGVGLSLAKRFTDALEKDIYGDSRQVSSASPFDSE